MINTTQSRNGVKEIENEKYSSLLVGLFDDLID
jgi:hypothetical protein